MYVYYIMQIILVIHAVIVEILSLKGKPLLLKSYAWIKLGFKNKSDTSDDVPLLFCANYAA